MKTVRVSKCGELERVCIYTRGTRWDSPQARKQKREWRKAAWKRINFRNCRDKLEDRIYCNFSDKDWHVAFSLAPAYNTTDYIILRSYWRRALQRLRAARKARGAPAPVYIYVLEGMHGDCRCHVHALIQATDGNDIEELHSCWPYGLVELTQIANFEHKHNLARYLTKEPKKFGRDRGDRNLFVASHNCVKPIISSYLVPDDWEFSLPPGAQMIHSDRSENEFGVFQYVKYRRSLPS